MVRGRRSGVVWLAAGLGVGAALVRGWGLAGSAEGGELSDPGPAQGRAARAARAATARAGSWGRSADQRPHRSDFLRVARGRPYDGQVTLVAKPGPVRTPAVPRGRPWRYEDLTDVPADGSKWEIIEGTLIVNPAPRPRHQQAVFQLGRLLADVCPPDLQVFISPIDWTIPDGGVVQPDLVVVRRSDVDLDEALSMPPVLVVEVLSPSNAAQDRLLKRDLYERLGVPSYWLVEPTEPGITALELDEATAKYVEVATVTGDRIFAVSAPYAVEFPASALA